MSAGFGVTRSLSDNEHFVMLSEVAFNPLAQATQRIWPEIAQPMSHTKQANP